MNGRLRKSARVSSFSDDGNLDASSPTPSANVSQSSRMKRAGATDRHTERLQASFGKNRALEQRLPPPIDPQLRHFLQRRSYSKALELLEAMQTSHAT